MNLLIFHFDLGAGHVCQGDHVRQHRRLDVKDHLEVPCVVFDFGFFGGEADEETLAVQRAKEVGTKMLFAQVVSKKGVMVKHGVTQLMKDNHRLALVAIQEEVKRDRELTKRCWKCRLWKEPVKWNR